MSGELYSTREEKQKAHIFFLNSINGVNLQVKSLFIYIQRLILQLSSLHVNRSSKIHDLPGCSSSRL